METLRQRLREQQGRHQGGSKWIGTAGTSPFGAYGYNPEGVRIGQDESRHRRAVKVWDRREFRNLDDRSSSAPATSRSRCAACAAGRARARPTSSTWTARSAPPPSRAGSTRHPARAAQRGQGAAVPRRRRLDGRPRPGGRGAVLGRAGRVQASRVLLLPQLPLRRRLARQPPPLGRADPDRGGAAHLRARLPGDLRRRRHDEPYEIVQPGGAIEHWNAESGEAWLRRLLDTWRTRSGSTRCREAGWGYSQSVAMIAEIFGGRMFR